MTGESIGAATGGYKGVERAFRLRRRLVGSFHKASKDGLLIGGAGRKSRWTRRPAGASVAVRSMKGQSCRLRHNLLPFVYPFNQRLLVLQKSLRSFLPALCSWFGKVRLRQGTVVVHVVLIWAFPSSAFFCDSILILGGRTC